MRKILICTVMLLALTATAAFALGRQAQAMNLSLGLSHGAFEYGEPIAATGSDYISVSPVDELGFNADFRKMFSSDYGMAFGFDYRFGSEKEEPTTNAAPGSPEVKITSTSWKIRLGTDRVGDIGDRFKWYMGPGLEYKSGKPKVEAGPSVDGENTNAWGLNGRIGGVMMINPKTGIYGQIGDSFGSASTKDTGGKTTWYYSNFEAAWGLQFNLGGAAK